MAKIETNANSITCWQNLEPMQVVFFLAGQLTQVEESIPWVRCASGNVYSPCTSCGRLLAGGIKSKLNDVVLIFVIIFVI